MHERLIVCLFLASLVPGSPRSAVADDNSKPEKLSLPRAEDEKAKSVQVSVDTSEVPDLADWGKQAKALAEKWHPTISHLLKSDGFTPPTAIKIVFKKDMKGVAYASGTTIVIAANWVHKHPEDLGMVVHELTHTIQGYRSRRNPGWLVEGIADYIRFFHFEPQTKIHVNPRRASYRDGYRTTAKFLAYVEKAHDKEIIGKLNEALRTGKYRDDLFKTRTSKTLDQLWSAFLASLERK
jgi:hypothetical protein